MKLIDETIELVSDSEAPLASAFIKAQIIAHKLKDREFSQWVRGELQGYADRDLVPDYRAAAYIPHGNLENRAHRYSNFKLPISGIPEDMRDQVLVSRFRQSIAVIEEFALNGKKLSLNIDQGLYPFLRDGIDPSYSITSAWGVFPEGTFHQILNDARSRLLDLLLNLSDNIPPESKESDLADVTKISGLNEIFKGAVFGHGANINFAIGDGSQASNNSSSVVENDIESLLKALAQINVKTEDVSHLREAIDQDASSHGLKPAQVGPKVRDWISTMISKAGTAAWDVPVQTAAVVLASAISRFYGL